MGFVTTRVVCSSFEYDNGYIFVTNVVRFYVCVIECIALISITRRNFMFHGCMDL